MFGQTVQYRSRTGRYTVPAIVTATTETLHPDGVQAWHQSDGRKGVPPLTNELHVHLTALTPGIPGQRALMNDDVSGRPERITENAGGTYQEWNVPRSDDSKDEQEPGTWAALGQYPIAPATD